MKRICLLLGTLLVASSSVVSADDFDLFKRLQKPGVHLASAQDLGNADISESYPAQYVDPEVLDDMTTPLIEQQAVPAEAAVEGQFGGSAEYVDGGPMIEPIAPDADVACGCGEGPIEQAPWAVGPSCPGACCCVDPCGGGYRCHLSGRWPCSCDCVVCEVAPPVPVCVDPCADAHGCHLVHRLHCGCRHGCRGGHGGHLLRHIRRCR